MATNRCRHHQGGFTLLEMLIALVVFGLLMVGLTAGVRTGLALRQAQIRHLGEITQLDATMRVLRTVLGRLPVTPQTRRLIARANGGQFKGEADRVSFVGDLPTGFGGTRRADMTLSVQRDRLILSWVPHRHEQLFAATPEPMNTELLADVRGLALSYWGSSSRGHPAAWQAQWEEPEAPELIRMRLRFAKGDSRRWPDLIVAPLP